MIKQTISGFTLLELMVVVAIMGIVAAIAVPNYRDMIERNRLREVVEGLKSDMQFARAEAIKRNTDIYVSRTTGNAGAWCYGLTANVLAAITDTCDCKNATSGTTDDCEIKIVSGSAYSTTNIITSSSSNRFGFKRGDVSSGSHITFNTGHYEAKVVYNQSGRVRICTPLTLSTGKTGLSEYPAC